MTKLTDKLQPNYHASRPMIVPIIVDEAIESPETVTLRYEEEAAGRNNGGDHSPTGLLPMSAYKHEAPQVHGTLSHKMFLVERAPQRLYNHGCR